MSTRQDVHDHSRERDRPERSVRPLAAHGSRTRTRLVCAQRAHKEDQPAMICVGRGWVWRLDRLQRSCLRAANALVRMAILVGCSTSGAQTSRVVKNPIAGSEPSSNGSEIPVPESITRKYGMPCALCLALQAARSMRVRLNEWLGRDVPSIQWSSFRVVWLIWKPWPSDSRDGSTTFGCVRNPGCCLSRVIAACAAAAVL